MSSFVPSSSSSHKDRVLVPADNSAPFVDIIRAVPSSNILPLPIPFHLTLIPRPLLTDVNWGPRFKHYVHTPRRSINHWLSVEILTYIFLHAIEAYDMTSYQLVTVCRRWRNVINGMTHLWSTLRLGTWTEIDNVDIWLERSKQGPLTIHIDPQRDAKNPLSSPPYAGLQFAFKSVDRWQHLVIAAFPTPEVFGCVVDALTAKPMGQLIFLEVGHRCQDSATLNILLDHISTTAVLLSQMTLLGIYAISSFLQPERHHVLNSLTTLIVDGKEMSQPVSILPLLVHLQSLDASHLRLPHYDASTILPCLSTLRKLRLRAVPIQWMAGREFKRLEDCTIVHVIGQREVQHRIDLPCCRTLTYRGHPLSTLQHFHAPRVKEMVVNSHDNKWKRAQQHLEHLCTLDGNISHLHTLHLTLQCSEKALMNVLEYMVPLQKLILTIAYPSPFWQSFFESLAAESSTKYCPPSEMWYHEYGNWKGWCSSETWHTNVVPSLKYLGIQSPKGFPQSQCLENLSLFRYVAWTRAQLRPPLEELKVWEGRGTTDDIVVDYTSTDYLDKHLGTSREDYDWTVVMGMVAQCLCIDNRATPLFKQLHPTILFRQLQVLGLADLPGEIHVLPYLEHIKVLEIAGCTIPAYSVDIALPLVHTLQQLRLVFSTASWMHGRTFMALEKCEFRYLYNGTSSYEAPQVDFPACTTLTLEGNTVNYSLSSCPNVQILDLHPDGHPYIVDDPIGEADFKSLHHFILNCSRLQELTISLSLRVGLDPLIHFIFCGACEQGVWNYIMSVEVLVVDLGDSEDSEEDSEEDFFGQMVGRQQHYAEQWAEFTVTKDRSLITLKAHM